MPGTFACPVTLRCTPFPLFSHVVSFRLPVTYVSQTMSTLCAVCSWHCRKGMKSLLQYSSKVLIPAVGSEWTMAAPSRTLQSQVEGGPIYSLPVDISRGHSLSLVDGDYQSLRGKVENTAPHVQRIPEGHSPGSALRHTAGQRRPHCSGALSLLHKVTKLLFPSFLKVQKGECHRLFCTCLVV